MTKPRIYQVLTFRKNADGTRTSAAHAVAAFSSEEAEASFREYAPEVMQDCECFISTDAIRDHENANVYLWCSLYDGKPADTVSENVFKGWASVVTRDEWRDGEHSPATKRRISARATTPA